MGLFTHMGLLLFYCLKSDFVFKICLFHLLIKIEDHPYDCDITHEQIPLKVQGLILIAGLRIKITKQGLKLRIKALGFKG